MSKDTVMPTGRWAFDSEVTAAFDDMLRRSIPGYESMRAACFDVGRRFVVPKTDIVDLGCSRGEALAPFVHQFGAINRYVGVERSAPMLEAARERFRGSTETGLMRLLDWDLRKGYPPAIPSLTLCVLTLQFTPIEYRQEILRGAFKATSPGGALVFVEKVIGSSAEVDRLLVDLYLEGKARNGYTADQIARKRESLEGVLVPVTARWNEDLLAGAGFRQVDCFWRSLNFAAWVAVKDRA